MVHIKIIAFTKLSIFNSIKKNIGKYIEKSVTFLMF